MWTCVVQCIQLMSVYLCTVYTVVECGPVETTEALETHIDGDTSHDGLAHSGGFQLCQHETMETALGPSTLQSSRASISARTRIFE